MPLHEGKRSLPCLNVQKTIASRFKKPTAMAGMDTGCDMTEEELLAMLKGISVKRQEARDTDAVTAGFCRQHRFGAIHDHRRDEAKAARAGVLGG